jgi:hypothetical protein
MSTHPQDPVPVDRAAVYTEVADRLAADAEQGAKEGLTRIYRRSAAQQVREWADEMVVEPPQEDEGDKLVCVDQGGSCDACGMEPFGTPAEGWRQAARFLRRSARVSGNREGALHGARLIEDELRRMADEARPTTQPETETLAAMFEGLGSLLATSSRDWGLYAPDAWLYAVILGWDCEQEEHDETCTHGAMEEMQERHSWSDGAVAKARRYRAAVRALTASAAAAQLGIAHAERRDRLAAGIYEYWNPGRSWADAHPDDIAGCRADADAAMTVADAVAGHGAAARTTSDTYREVASRLDQFARKSTPGWARYCGLASLKVDEWAAQMIRPRTPDRVHTAEGGRTVTTITLQRHCPAGHRLGDATQAEVLAASDGRPLPDARYECSACQQEASVEEQPS